MPTPTAPATFHPKKGNYKGLLVYHKAECIYDITFYFANHYFMASKDRTVDQMIQAARSGKQNIAEGCAAASTSSETELKLMNVARASMQELLTDYEDYLRVRGLEQWPMDDARTAKTMAYCKSHNTPEDYMALLPTRSDETIANIAITLIHQFDGMMKRLIERLEQDFVQQGGIRERMTAARLGFRNDQKAQIEQLTQENARLRQENAQLRAEIERLRKG